MIKECQNFKIVSAVQDRSGRQINRYPAWIPDLSLPHMNQMNTIFHVGGEGCIPEDYLRAGVGWDEVVIKLRSSTA